jgi:tetratricopeptide (TPR) repeat protein
MSESIGPDSSLDGAVALSWLPRGAGLRKAGPRRVGSTRALAAALVIVLAAATASAQSLPQSRGQSLLVAEVNAWQARYHENLPRIDQMRVALVEAAKTDPQVDTLVALAKVCFIFGDVRAKNPEEKLEGYDQGQKAAQRAVELAPNNAQAHFWHAINTARWGQTKGVMRSLFLLPAVKQEIKTVLELDPTFPPVYSLAGSLYIELPSLLGGDLDKGEEMFRKGLELDPRFTSARVGLGKALIKQSRLPEARRELEAVLAERAPANLADWTMKDSRRARELLESIKGKS